MSTIAPHQLPTPSQMPASVPAPVAPFTPFAPVSPAAPVAAPVGRTRSALVRRLTVAGIACVAAVAVGVAGIGLTGGDASADERAAAEREERRQEREDEREEKERAATAGNASIDVAPTYAALFGATPAASVVACIESAAEPVIADVQALVDGIATAEQMPSALSPFASCVAIDDFDAAMVMKASGLVAPLQLDEACTASVLGTFTEVDRLDVLVTAVVDPTTYDQAVYNTFNPCSF